jgi:hypothetical protein
MGEPDNPKARFAHIDESNYYYIKVNNEADDVGTRRTLVLDNLIHGYELLGHPNRLDYDYEHIYAYVTNRIVEAKAKRGGAGSTELGTLFLGGGSYTFPRFLQAVYPRVWCEIAEIDPAVTRANHMALGLAWPEPRFPVPEADPKTGRDVVTIQRKRIPLGPSGSGETTAAYIKALASIAPAYRRDTETGQAVVTIQGNERKLGPYESAESYTNYVLQVKQWFESSPYRIRTNWGDARQFAVKNQDRERKFDIVFGDAFNDFSVPWHLTTKEFNDLIAKMLTPEGVYMINIIDLYESDNRAAERGPLKGLQNRLAAALRPNWRGQKSAEDAAGAAAAQVSTGVLSREWERLGTWAGEAFADDLGEHSRSDIASRLRARRDADRSDPPADAEGNPFSVPTVEKLKRILQPVYDTMHANDALAGIDDLRATMAFRNKKAQAKAVDHVQALREHFTVATTNYERTKSEENRRNMDARERELEDADEHEAREELLRQVVAGVLDSLRGQMDRLGSPLPSRMALINNQLDRLIETAGTLSSVAAKDMDETISLLAKKLEKDLEAKKITVDEGDVQILLIGAVRQLSRPSAENRPVEQALAQSGALDAARALRSQLSQMRIDINQRVQPALDAAKGDATRAETTAAVARDYLADRNAWIEDAATAIVKARQVGGFLGSWIETARQTFPHIYVYGTHSRIGVGQRETFVVVASKLPLDLKDLGQRPGDLTFITDGAPTLSEQYPDRDMRALKLRAHGLILTDDHAPVDNLLAPVAATRGDD